MTAGTGQSKLGMVLRVTSGNFLEMFDFFLSGVYASYIAKAFFPLENEYASLLLTFVAFGAGFLMRPLGAIILGAYRAWQEAVRADHELGRLHERVHRWTTDRVLSVLSLLAGLTGTRRAATVNFSPQPAKSGTFRSWRRRKIKRASCSLMCGALWKRARCCGGRLSASDRASTRARSSSGTAW